MAVKSGLAEDLREAYSRSKEHTTRYDHCRAFDSTPIRTAQHDPCPVGRVLIQYVFKKWNDAAA